MQDFDKHKANFDSFLNKIDENEKVAILAHANCLDGVSSAILMNEILRKKYPNLPKPEIHFIYYVQGSLDKLHDSFKEKGIRKVFLVDLGVDASLYEEFERLRQKFDILLIDHHPMNPNLKIDEHIIKTHSHDCTSLVLFRFGEGIIDYNEWKETACVAAVSEFSWKSEENMKLIKSYYPEYDQKDQDSYLLSLVKKMNHVINYYSKETYKAYELILSKDSTEIDKISKEVSDELSRLIDDFEKNAEKHFNDKLCFYFFKSKFSLGSNIGTVLSLIHEGSTIIVLSDIEGTNMIKVSGRNNGNPLIYPINEMMRAGVKDLDNSLAGGHNPAAGGSFMKKDLEKFKENIIAYVRSKLNK